MIKLKQIHSKGLAHNSYFLSSGNEACIIDPRRDARVYLELAWKEEANIKYVFETHRNEDYVIGSMELADVVNLEIIHGPGLDWKYGKVFEEGQEFTIGNLKIKALHTPGHTDESSSYVVFDMSSGEEPVMVFTGDTLFIGDTGRIDMYGPDEAPRLAEKLYHSIFEKLLPLGDYVIILPGHGAGSVCGGAISDREQSTIGLEKKQNFILRKTEKKDFIQHKLEENHYYAPYFEMMEKYNLEGPPLLKNVPRFKPFLASIFKERIKNGGVVIDTRNPTSFGSTHIPNSYNIWLEGLPSYAGWVIPYDKPLLLVVRDFHNLTEAHKYLLRLGYDNIEGYLVGGITSWYSQAYPTDSFGLLTVSELKQKLETGEKFFVLDVRSLEERKNEFIEGTKHVYVGELSNKLDQLPKDKPIATLCGNGSRASLAASILKRNGFKEIFNVLGSMIAWKNAKYPLISN